MAFWFTCNVNRADASGQNGETPTPVVYLVLTDSGGQFNNTIFFAADAAKREILAVALAAISTGLQVYAAVDPPTPGAGNTQCYQLAIIAS